MTEPLIVRIEDEAGASIVALLGELDLSTIRRMENPLLVGPAPIASAARQRAERLPAIGIHLQSLADLFETRG